MNYLSHTWVLLGSYGHNADSPRPCDYEVAGTSLPDWLSVVDRKVRVRSQAAAEWLEDTDPAHSGLARGVMRHHADDAWFHNSEAFLRLSIDFARQLRDRWGDETGMRSGFVGHILVEILLDARLSVDHPWLLDYYYEAVGRVDARKIETWVNQTSRQRSDRIAGLIPRLVSEGFLRDYVDDEKLLLRLNQVMRRVRLPELPDSVLAMFPEARDRVREQQTELLTPPRSASTES